MEINSNAAKERKLEEYDITFTGGHMMTISVCPEEGDTSSFDAATNTLKFNLTAKKTLTTQDALELPPEDITIYTSHILAVQHRTRVIPPLTAEQKSAWEQTVKQFTRTIQ